MSFADFKLIGLNRFPTSLYMWGDNTNGLLGDNNTPSYFSWSKISSGGLHTVAIRSDGLLFAWGRNTEGQLGDTTTVHRSSPVQLSVTLSWNAVSAGLSHTVAIRGDSTLWVWGANRYGQLGDGTTVNKSSWVQVGTSSWSTVSAGGNHTAGVKLDSSVFAWGFNGSGQLADNSVSSRSSPVQVGTSGLTDANAYSLNFNGTQYLSIPTTSAFNLTPGQDWTIEVWIYPTKSDAGYDVVFNSNSGSNFFWGIYPNAGGNPYIVVLNNGLGIGTLDLRAQNAVILLNQWQHIALVNYNGTIKQYLNGVSTGTSATAGTYTFGNPMYIGSNVGTQIFSGNMSNFRFVNGTAVYTTDFTPSTTPLTAITNTILLTAQNTTIIDNSGSSRSITNNGGISYSFNTPFTSAIATGGFLATTVSAGKTHTVAITTDNKLYAWGDNTYGEIGDGTTINRSSPTQIGSSSWSQVSAGGTHTAAIESDGSLMTWGYNNYGQLGLNTPYSGTYYTQVSEGPTHTLAIRNDGALFVWGRNQLGQLGLGDTITRSSPVQLGTSSWTNVDAGSSHSLAVRSDGKLFTWGSNDWGQLGNNPNQYIITWSKIVTSSSGMHTMAIKNDGTLWGWGLQGSEGRIGDGSTVAKSSPTQVGTLNTWIDIAAGSAHSIGITNDNVLYAWGSSTFGQLGDGTANSKPTPVIVGYNYKKVFAGYQTSIAIDNNDYAYIWGDNSNGLIPGGVVGTHRSSIALLNTDTTWSSFSIDQHILGTKTDGSLWTWGLGTTGQLGLADLVSRSSPTQIGASSWIQISAGLSYSVGITVNNSLFAWGLNASGQLGLSDTVNRSSPASVGTAGGLSDSNAYSLYFSGLATYLSIPKEAITMSASGTTTNPTFTIECWYYRTGSGDHVLLGSSTQTSPAFTFKVDSTRNISLNIGGTQTVSTTTLSLNKWYHIALTRLPTGSGDNANFNVYLDGVLNFTMLNTYAMRNVTAYWIGRDIFSGAAQYLIGYISNYRISNKIVYTGNFTVPSSSLGTVQLADTNIASLSSGEVTFLTAQTTNITPPNDSSNNAYTITVVGTLSSSQLTPFTSAIATGSTIATQVVAGSGFTAMTDSLGYLYTWGLNGLGQLGTTNVVNRSSPVQVGTDTFNFIIASNSHATAIRSTDNALFTWGRNLEGDLGDGTVVTKSSPTQIGTTSANYSSPVQVGTSSYTAVSAGEGHSLGLGSDGILYAWGKNDQGQIGGATNTLGIGWSKVVVGPTHSLGIRFDGKLYTWGDNIYGQLGDRTIAGKTSPILIGTNTWKDVTVGQSLWAYSMAITTDGKLFAWGANQAGILGWLSWRQISAGAGHTLLLRSDGVLYAMGLNNAGQLGDNTVSTNRSSPVVVSTGSWSFINAGVSTSAAIDTRGRLFTWGYNNVGQLGLATTANRSSPTQVSTGSWSQVAVEDYMLAITTQGSIWSWGNNSNGQLGLGTTVNSKVPKLLDGTPTSYSTGFDGIADYLSITDATAFDLATGTPNWTIECWFYLTSLPSASGVLIQKDGTSGTIQSQYSLSINSTGTIQGVLSPAITSTGNQNFISTATVSINTWYHVAMVRNSNNLTIFLNGVAVVNPTAITITMGDSTRPLTIGANNPGASYFPGYISNVRIVKGQALYTSRFTPSITPLTTTSQGISSGTVSLLTLQNATIIDNSTANGGIAFTLTSTGTPTTTAYNPFSLISSTSSTSWTQVAAGTNSLAIRNDSTLYAWGQNNYGQLGDNTTINKSSPIQVSTSSWTLISASMTGHSLGVEIDGSLFAWGRNTYGELGLNNEFISVSSPTQVGTNSYTSISAGNNTSLALSLNGNNNVLFGWGLNDVNQLNNIAAFSWRSIRNGAGIQSSTGSTVGKLYLWGDNTYGQLGDSTRAARSSPTQLGGFYGAATYKQIITTPLNTVILASDDTLYMMGDNTYGQLGLSDTISRSSPVQVGTTTWSSVAISGTGHVVALSMNGILFAWGNNQYNELGQSDLVVANRSSPVIIGTNADWTKVSVGHNYSLAINSAGSMYVWGRNDFGQLGTAVPLSYTSIGAGVALRNDGKLYAWGDNSSGQVGDGTTANRSAPTQISTTTLTSTSWSVVSGSNNNHAGIKVDGTLWAWGDNTYGQLGIYNTAHRSSPVQVGVDIGITSWSQVFVTPSNIYAIRASDNTLWGWGDNSYGQLGQNDTISQSSPVQIAGNKTWSTVAIAGTGHILAIRNDGTLWSWGNNQFNELGYNQSIQTNYSSPVQVGTSSWTKVSAGNNNSFAIRADSTLWGWGRNDFGQIGTTVVTPLSWTTVAGGDSYSVAIRSDGKLFSWGRNDKGQLGLGHTINKSAPTQIATSTNYNYYSTSFTSTDYLSVPANTAFVFSGDFTIEGWMYFTNVAAATVQSLIGLNSSTNFFDIRWFTTRWQISLNAGSGTDFGTHPSPTNNTWVHVACVRLGSSINLYVNGKSTGVTLTNNSALGYNNVSLFIGASAATSNLLYGNLTSVRIVNGQALYTSNFAPSTTPLTTTSQGALAANVVLLACQNSAFIDNSTASVKTITPGGANISTSTLTPFPVTAYNYSWTQVSATLSHTVAIRNDGTLWAWGGNNAGQLGQADTTTRSTPIQIGASSWIAVGTGNDASFAIRNDYKLFAWGDNTNGILGQSDTLTRSSPVQIGTSSWTSVSATQHAVGVTTANTMFAWGLNSAGQVGDHTTVNKSTPTLVLAGFTPSLMVYNSATVVDNSGNAVTMTATGSPTVGNTVIPFSGTYSVNFPTNNYYTTGSLPALGTQYTFEFWAYVTGVPSGNWYWTFVGGSLPMFYFIGNGSSVTSIGKVNSGGGGNFSGSVSLALNTWAHVAYTRNSSNLMTIWLNGTSVATSSDSSSYTGGAFLVGYPAGGNGGAGNGYLSNFRFVNNACLYTSTFTPPTSLTIFGITSSLNYTKSSAGNSHSVAIRSDGYLFTWGNNAQGQLGSSTTTNRSFAVQIGASSWSQINAGASWTAGTLTTNGLFTWGTGNNGELGSGATLQRSSPVQVGALTTWSILTGKTHVLSTTTAGALFTWGTNTAGQVGDNTTVVKSSPVGVASLTNLIFDNVSSPTQIGSSSWTQVAAGDLFTNALRAVDGGLFTWGYGFSGRLGSSATTNRSSPVQVGASSWLQVSTGNTENTVALTIAYTMFSWGKNTVGQVGDNTTVARSAPVQVGAALNTNLMTDIIKAVTKLDNNSWSQISAGDFHSYALRSTTSLFSWGKNDVGQLGDGGATRSSPVQVGAGNYLVISAGYSFGAAITTAGILQTTGLNDKGQQGNSSTTNRNTITAVGASVWTAVNAGVNSVIATTTSNVTFVWGNNASGQLGLADTINRSSPVVLGSSLAASMYQTVYPSPVTIGTYSNTSWTQVSVGDSFSVGLDTAGRLFAWGLNNTGQLGDGSSINTMPTKSSPSQIATTASSFIFVYASSPVQVSSGTSWNAVYAGGTHTVAIQSNGTLWSWGVSSYGQTGNGSTINQFIPKQVDTLNSFVAVAAGTDFSIAINTDKTLWRWGYNSSTDIASPHRSNAVQLGSDSWNIISAGGNTAVAINSLGRLYGWGKITTDDAFNFNLGISPITWAIGSSYTNVNAGDSFIHALDSNYGLWGYGYNINGQLGDNSVITRSSPVQIGSVYSWSIIGNGIGATPLHAGSLFLTGLNSNAQLGIGGIASRSSPTQVPSGSQQQFNFPVRIGISRWSQMSAGYNHNLAIRDDSTLWSWGNNVYGQLGIGDIVNYSSPVQIGTSSWIAVSAGRDHSGGVRLNNTLWTWGLNTRGQLGDSTTTNRISPVQVGTGYWNNISIGAGHTTALADNNTLYVWGDDNFGQ